MEAADWLSGDHRMDGVLAAAGPSVVRERFDGPFQLVDLAPTVLAAAGAPASVRHSGSALAAVLGTDVAERAGVAGVEGRVASPEPASALDDSEASEVEEHLRGLGYLE